MLHPFRTALVAVAALAAVPASAVPTFDTFGPFPDATFGGSGIPNDSVAASDQFVVDFSTAAGIQSAWVTIAMNATQRFENDPVTNDNFGTFFADPGSNFGDPDNPMGPGPSAREGATWNFNFYVDVMGINGSMPLIEDFDITLFYDFDPAVDTPISQRGRINLDELAAANVTVTTRAEGSENLLFAEFQTGVPPFIVPPTAVTSFDPDATGQYNFAIQVVSKVDSSQLSSVGIDVVVPEPATLALVGLGGLLVLGRRKG